MSEHPVVAALRAQHSGDWWQHPLLLKARELCTLIEELPAHEDQTRLISHASEVSFALQQFLMTGKHHWPQTVPAFEAVRHGERCDVCGNSACECLPSEKDLAHLSPFRKAWTEFESAADKSGMLDSTTLGASPTKKYLRNRLWHAFEAGWNAGRAHGTDSEPATIPDVLFNGHEVWLALSGRALKRTGAENVSDVLDAVVRLLKDQGLSDRGSE